MAGFAEALVGIGGAYASNRAASDAVPMFLRTSAGAQAHVHVLR